MRSNSSGNGVIKGRREDEGVQFDNVLSIARKWLLLDVYVQT